MRAATEIFGAEPVPALWWGIAGTCLLLAVALPVVLRYLARRRERARLRLSGGEGLEPTRTEYLAAIGRVDAQWRASRMGAAEAMGEATRLVREFVGLATDDDVNSLTLAELEERCMLSPDLAPVAGIVRRGYPLRFGGGQAEPEAVSETLSMARETVQRWR